MRVSIFIFCLVLSIFSGIACATHRQNLSHRNSQLTQGNIQMNLVVGKTTKIDVLKKFGAPNITTRNGQGIEVWTYQRAAQQSQSSNQGGVWSLLFIGSSQHSSQVQNGSRMITLIIEFNEKDVVSDFRSKTSDF